MDTALQSEVMEPEVERGSNDQDYLNIFITPEILCRFMAQIRCFINNAEQQLQTEERGNEIAKLQGYCAGHRTLIAVLREAGYSDFELITKTEKPMIRHEKNDGYDFYSFVEKLPLSKLFLLYTDINILFMSDCWKLVLKKLNERIQNKKDWLYSAAGKGRDMHFVHGWDFVISLIDNWADCLKKEYLSAKQQYDKEQEDKKEELPFDEE